MQIWGKKKQEDRPPEGVAQAAVEGASRQELVREAIRILSKESDADRLGVWIEQQPEQKEETSFPLSFRGIVWERGVEVTPSEWARLSPEFPLPQELFAGKSVEQDLDRPPAGPMLGPLMEMQHAVWVAVGRRGRLRGVLLAGTRTRKAERRRRAAGSVATLAPRFRARSGSPECGWGDCGTELGCARPAERNPRSRNRKAEERETRAARGGNLRKRFCGSSC
jgi:hypothetical protein